MIDPNETQILTPTDLWVASVLAQAEDDPLAPLEPTFEEARGFTRRLDRAIIERSTQTADERTLARECAELEAWLRAYA